MLSGVFIMVDMVVIIREKKFGYNNKKLVLRKKLDG